MGPRTSGTETRFAALRAAYDGAFRQYSLHVGSLQSLLHHAAPDCTVIEEARLRVERARSEYRESRDLLALFLLGRDKKAARGVEVCIRRIPFLKVTPESERFNLRRNLEAQQVA